MSYVTLPQTYPRTQPGAGIISEESGLFRISNHLNCDVEIRVTCMNIHQRWLDPSGCRAQEISVCAISAKNFMVIPRDDFREYFKEGNFILTYLTKDGSLYSIYKVHKSGIKNLHVGMVTSRFLGSVLPDISKSGNAQTGGRSWIRIHNFSKQLLCFNDGIFVKPGKSKRYAGRYEIGIPLGFFLRDCTGKYDMFVMEQPCTDIYYGISSDLNQPTFGGLQYGEEFNDRTDQNFVWLLQNGHM